MYHYLFTNDLRISVLDESLKRLGNVLQQIQSLRHLLIKVQIII